MKTIRLTAAQAMMRWLAVQMTPEGDRFIEGVWAIFGHGNVAGIGEALHGVSKALPTWRGQNEQTMAHAAIAYAKTKRRRRAHAVTSSIGPGATNMITAAAVAHVNRLRFCSSRATSSQIVVRIRSCNRSRILMMGRSARTTASARSAATSTA